jgi:hypothetical protein
MDPLGYSDGKYGGSIREAGGAFGARESAREEVYFRQQDEQKLAELKQAMDARERQQQAVEQEKQHGDKTNH